MFPYAVYVYNPSIRMYLDSVCYMHKVYNAYVQSNLVSKYLQRHTKSVLLFRGTYIISTG